MATSAIFTSGCSWGPYTIVGPAGHDTPSDLYRARDTRANRTVLIKALTADVEWRRAAPANAVAAASFAHANVAALREIRAADSRDLICLISENVSGVPLKTALARRRYSQRRSIDLATELAEALADVHAAGLMHGDLCPDNIMVTPEGRAKILHVGLTTQACSNRLRPRDGYMAPERVLGIGVEARTDVFSLGAILVEMLTGDPLPAGNPAREAAGPHELRIPVLAGFGQSASSLLQATLSSALAGKADERCGSAAAFAAELRAVAAILDLHATPGLRSL
jgi:eukaryotic-like serine/threonine-protein kinase